MMNSEEILTNTISNGEVEVNVSPVGTFYGSDSEGNAIPENLTEESLQRLADQLNSSNEQILVDADHASCRAGIEKDTSACGWLEKFFVKPLKGLWAKLKLTNKGRDLVENRVYRFLSPVFKLDENGEPMQLNSVAMTNCPALAPEIAPIINTKPKLETLEMTMTKEQLVDLIKETVKNMETVEEKTEEMEKTEETTETAENACQDTEEKVENACSEEKAKNEKTVEEVKEVKEAVNTETEAKAEVKEEVTEPEKKEEEKKEEEVIKIEALNSSPTALKSLDSKDWMNLHGKEFFDYLAKHPEIKG